MPPGVKYGIRVYDKCGDALVRDYTLVVSESNLIIGGTINPETLTSCTSLDVTNSLTPTDGTMIEFYEIFKGPKTVPKQTSDTFTDLPPGQYGIEVYDKCGDATFGIILWLSVDPNLTIGGTINP